MIKFVTDLAVNPLLCRLASESFWAWLLKKGECKGKLFLQLKLSFSENFEVKASLLIQKGQTL